MPNRSPDAVTPGSLPLADHLRRAFVDGAAWVLTNQDLRVWPHNRGYVHDEAVRRYGDAPVCEWIMEDGRKTIFNSACGSWVQVSVSRIGEFRFCPFCGRTIKREEKSDE